MVPSLRNQAKGGFPCTIAMASLSQLSMLHRSMQCYKRGTHALDVVPLRAARARRLVRAGGDLFCTASSAVYSSTFGPLTPLNLRSSWAAWSRRKWSRRLQCHSRGATLPALRFLTRRTRRVGPTLRCGGPHSRFEAAALPCLEVRPGHGLRHSVRPQLTPRVRERLQTAMRAKEAADLAEEKRRAFAAVCPRACLLEAILRTEDRSPNHLP